MKRFLLLAILLNFTILLNSADLTAPNFVFINSVPIRAKVIIDGIDKGLLTPCLLKNINPTQKMIKITKAGYKDRLVKFTDIENNKINVFLTPGSFDLFFPERFIYRIGYTEVQGPIFATNLPSGTYNVNIFNDRIYFTKISPFLPAEIALGTSLGFSLTAMFTSIGLAEYYDLQANSSRIEYDQRHYQDVSQGFKYAEYATISITAAVALALTAIVISDVTTAYYNKKQKIQLEDKQPTSYGKNLYDTALQFLSIGEIEKSTNILNSMITLYPDSDYIPNVYYQIGQNYYIIQDYNNAINNWEKFINNFPLADYYDYVLKNIAEIYYLKKDFEKALIYLDKVVYTENILDRETIFAFKAKINYELYFAQKDDKYYKSAERDYLTLVDNSSNSEQLDFYYSQLIKLYKIIGDTDKISKLKGKAEGIKESSLKQLILSYFK